MGPGAKGLKNIDAATIGFLHTFCSKYKGDGFVEQQVDHYTKLAKELGRGVFLRCIVESPMLSGELLWGEGTRPFLQALSDSAAQASSHEVKTVRVRVERAVEKDPVRFALALVAGMVGLNLKASDSSAFLPDLEDAGLDWIRSVVNPVFVGIADLVVVDTDFIFCSYHFNELKSSEAADLAVKEFKKYMCALLDGRTLKPSTVVLFVVKGRLTPHFPLLCDAERLPDDLKYVATDLCPEEVASGLCDELLKKRGADPKHLPKERLEGVNNRNLAGSPEDGITNRAERSRKRTIPSRMYLSQISVAWRGINAVVDWLTREIGCRTAMAYSQFEADESISALVTSAARHVFPDINPSIRIVGKDSDFLAMLDPGKDVTIHLPFEEPISFHSGEFPYIVDDLEFAMIKKVVKKARPAFDCPCPQPHSGQDPLQTPSPAPLPSSTPQPALQPPPKTGLYRPPTSRTVSPGEELPRLLMAAMVAACHEPVESAFDDLVDYVRSLEKVPEDIWSSIYYPDRRGIPTDASRDSRLKLFALCQLLHQGREWGRERFLACVTLTDMMGHHGGIFDNLVFLNTPSSGVSPRVQRSTSKKFGLFQASSSQAARFDPTDGTDFGWQCAGRFATGGREGHAGWGQGEQEKEDSSSLDRRAYVLAIKQYRLLMCRIMNVTEDLSRPIVDCVRTLAGEPFGPETYKTALEEGALFFSCSEVHMGELPRFNGWWADPIQELTARLEGRPRMLLVGPQRPGGAGWGETQKEKERRERDEKDLEHYQKVARDTATSGHPQEGGKTINSVAEEIITACKEWDGQDVPALGRKLVSLAASLSQHKEWEAAANHLVEGGEVHIDSDAERGCYKQGGVLRTTVAQLLQHCPPARLPGLTDATRHQLIQFLFSNPCFYQERPQTPESDGRQTPCSGSDDDQGSDDDGSVGHPDSPNPIRSGV